jgi:hypothetical protein
MSPRLPRVAVSQNAPLILRFSQYPPELLLRTAGPQRKRAADDAENLSEEADQPAEDRRTIRRKRSRRAEDDQDTAAVTGKPRETKRQGRPSELPGALPDQEDETEAMDTDVESQHRHESNQSVGLRRPEQPARSKKRDITDVETVVSDAVTVGRAAPRPSKKGRPRSPEDVKRMPSVLDRPGRFQPTSVGAVQPPPGRVGRKPGDEWTNDAGDRFRIDDDGRVRRLVEVKEWRRKLPKMVRRPHVCSLCRSANS